MRKLRFGVFLVLSCFCLAAALSARAGDKVAEDPDAKRVSGKLPDRKVDLSGVDVEEPPGKHQPRAAGKGPDGTAKKKEIVRYKAATLVPEGAGVLVEFSEVARTRRSVKDSPLGRLMDEEMLGRVWREEVIDVLRKVPPARKGRPGPGGMVDILVRMSELLGGEVIVALYPPAGGKGGHRLLLVGEMDEREMDAFRDSVEDLKKWAGLERESSISTVTRGDFEYDRIVFQKREAVSHGFVGNQLVVAVGGGLYEKVLAAAVSKGDHSISRDREWARIREHLGKNADVYLRADVKSLVDLATGEEMTPEQRKAIKDAHKGLRYVAAAVSFSTGAVRERFFAALEPDSALFKMFPATGPSQALAKLIPLDALYYQLEKVTVEALARSYQMREKLLKSLAPAGAAAPLQYQGDFLGKLAALAKKAGLSMEKRVLPALAGDWAVAVTVTGMGPSANADLLLVVQPQNLKETEEVLKKLEGVSRQKFRSEKYMGARLKFWIKSSKEARKSAAPFSLPKLSLPGFAKLKEKGPLGGPFKAYALANRYLILGTSARVVKMAIRQTDPDRQSSCIKDKPDYDAARAKLDTSKQEISLGYADLRRGGELLYAAGGFLGKEVDLPPADKVLGELSGAVWSVRREKSPARTGLTVEVHSPVGMLPLGAGAGLRGWVAAMRAAAQREKAAHTYKLKAIWRGLETFATDFGRYPIKLSELYQVYVADSSNFLTLEQEEAKVKIDKAAEVNTKTGYRYVTGRSPNAVANTVVMYSAKADARGMHWCLYAGGRVKPVAAENLPALLGKKK